MDNRSEKKMIKFSINEQPITQDAKPFIIAEAGINHNGHIDLAYKMIEAAKQAGCDAVKFQTFKASEFCGDPNQMFTYQSQGQEVTEPMLEMFQRHEFNPKQWQDIKHYCDQTGICFLSTPQNKSDLDLLLSIGIKAIKIGSDDFTNLPLIKAYQQTGLPIILSCGMADCIEIQQSLTLFNMHTDSPYPFVLCLCTSQYPTPPKDINLNKFKTLKRLYPNLILGFSDHSQGTLASSLAVAHGAVVFEKHFTLDNNLEGPDHWFSENPESLKNWVKDIRLAHLMQGRAQLEPTAEEIPMRTLARRSICAIKPIKKGEILTADNIGLKRPGDGLPPKMLEELIGKVAYKDMNTGEKIKLGDFVCEH